MLWTTKARPQQIHHIFGHPVYPGEGGLRYCDNGELVEVILPKPEEKDLCKEQE
jgi:hypothetical protein